MNEFTYSNKLIPRTAGYGYLIIFISGIFANFFVLESLIVAGNAAATANNIIANEFLYRIGILSFVIMVIVDVLVAWALYIFLKPVNNNLSLLAAWLRLVNCAVFGIALIDLINVLEVLNSTGLSAAGESGNGAVQAMLLLKSFDYTWIIGLIFFGLHLFLLGYLIIKSDYIPSILGFLLIAASFGYLIDSFAHFLLSNYTDYKEIFEMIVVIPGIIGELSFCLWLLIKGTKIPQIKLST